MPCICGLSVWLRAPEMEIILAAWSRVACEWLYIFTLCNNICVWAFVMSRSGSWSRRFSIWLSLSITVIRNRPSSRMKMDSLLKGILFFTHHCHADIFTLQFNQKICSQFMIEFTETTLPFLLTVTLDLDLRCWFSIPDELWSSPIHMQKIKVRGYAVLMLKWKQMDRQTDMTEFITFLQISC